MKKLTIILTLVLLGCDGGSDGGDPTPADTVVAEDTAAPEDTTAPEDTVAPEDTEADVPVWTGQGCAPWDKVGRFEVFSDPMGSWVTGVVHDSVSAYDAILQPKEIEGGCVLWMGLNPNFCDPQCVSGQECGEGGVCQSAPQRKDAGTVTVTGLKEPLDLETNTQVEYKVWDFVGSPYETGADITLTAAGNEIEGFEMTGVGVPPLVSDDMEWVISPGTPLDVTWEPEEGSWEVWLQLNVDQHGLTPVTLRCTLPDTGSHTISGEMIDLLIQYGASGAAKGRIHRRTLDSAEVAQGCVELEVFTWQQAKPKCVGCPCTTPGFCPE